MSKNQLASRAKSVPIHSMDDVARVSDMMAKSGFFSDVKEAAQAGVKIMAGMAWGIDPFNAMTGIHIIKNRPTVSAGLMAAAIKSSGKYDYRIRQRDDKRCEIAFYQGSEELQPMSVYTVEMAKRAGLLTNPSWQKYPEAMLFARAMSQGVRMHAPDVFMASVYTPEELGAEVNDEDEVITAPVQAHDDVETLDVTYTTSQPTVEPSGAVVTLPAATTEPTEGIGEERAEKLVKILAEKHQVDNPLPFAQLFLNRDLTSLAELTEAEGVELLKAATEVQP